MQISVIVKPKLIALSPRETEVLSMSERGLLYKEIAHLLGISVFTAKAHGLHVRLKLGAGNMREAAWLLRNPK